MAGKEDGGGGGGGGGGAIDGGGGGGNGGSSNSGNSLARIGTNVTHSPIFQKSKRALSKTARFSQKLLWSTGKAAWIAGTSFLVFVVPLIIEMDREQQMVDLESQSAGLLGAPPPGK